MEGIELFGAYAPVIQWTTVRVLLILEVLLNLKSNQGNIITDFLHAELEEYDNVFVDTPMGFRNKRKGSETQEDSKQFA